MSRPLQQTCCSIESSVSGGRGGIARVLLDAGYASLRANAFLLRGCEGTRQVSLGLGTGQHANAVTFVSQLRRIRLTVYRVEQVVGKASGSSDGGGDLLDVAVLVELAENAH